MDFQQEHWQETKKKLVRSIKDNNNLNYLINQQIIFHQNYQKQVQKEREKREIVFATKETQIKQLQAEVERLKKEVLCLFVQQKNKDTEAIKFQQQIIELKEKNQTLTQELTNLKNLNQQQKQTIQDSNQIIHQKDQQLINQQQIIQQQAQRIKELENKPPQVTVKKETVTVDNPQQKEEIQHLKAVIQELETKL